MSTTRRATIFGAMSLALAITGCSATNGGTDTGVGGHDGGASDAAITDDSGADAGAMADTNPPIDTGVTPDTGTDAGSPSVDAAPSGVTYCTSAGGCASRDTCQVALCSMTTPAQGFCTPSGRPTCGGFVGTSCPPGEFSQCLGQGSCVADALGICVTSAERADICAHQPTLWGCS